MVATIALGLVFLYYMNKIREIAAPVTKEKLSAAIAGGGIKADDLASRTTDDLVSSL